MQICLENNIKNGRYIQVTQTHDLTDSSIYLAGKNLIGWKLLVDNPLCRFESFFKD